MLRKIKDTLKHSAIYSIGNIATKLIGLILLPLYTKHITVSEYGILGILEITIMILTQVLNVGQTYAYIRFHDLEEYKIKRKSVLFTIFIFLLSIGLLLNLVGQYFSPKLSALFSQPIEFTIYFRLCFIIIFLRVINNLFLSVLRAKEKSSIFAIANITKLIITLVFNIYFVAFFRIGVLGILFSYLIGECLLFLILFPNIIREIIPKIDFRILKGTLIFGFPLVFTALSGMLLNMGDRYILKLLVDYKEVGLYNLGYKVAGVLNVFLIQSFSLALLPIGYKMYKRKGDKRYYSKMQTYFMFVLFWASLFLVSFNKELIKLLALNSSYWPAYHVVPLIVMGYIFSGAKSVASIGLYLKGKTNYLAYNTIIAAVLNIVLNFLLIPKYKMIGAAFATVISFAVLFFLTYFTAFRFYKISYENSKLALMFLVSIGLYLISNLTNGMVILPRIIIKLLIIFSFPFILYVFKFYEPIELATIKAKWSKLTSSFKK